MTDRSDLGVRVLSGIAMLGVAVLALWWGGLAFWALASCAALLVLGEWAVLVRATQGATRLALSGLGVALLSALPTLALPLSWQCAVLAGGMVFTLVGGRVLSRNGRGIRALAAGVGYCGLAVLALMWVRGLPDWGLTLALWALGCVWATDIGAYFTGRALGGPKLAPRISPNKTWSGLIGGMIAAFLWGWAVHYWGGLPIALILGSPLLAVLAQGGDLMESAMKRRVGVKDSGTLLPGHGGAFDRLDGMLAALPAAAVLILLVYGVGSAV